VSEKRSHALARFGDPGPRAGIADEAAPDRRDAMRRDRRESLLLLFTLVVPVLAVVQERRRRRAARAI
jgi:hypothetical protein